MLAMTCYACSRPWCETRLPTHRVRLSSNMTGSNQLVGDCLKEVGSQTPGQEEWRNHALCYRCLRILKKVNIHRRNLEEARMDWKEATGRWILRKPTVNRKLSNPVKQRAMNSLISGKYYFTVRSLYALKAGRAGILDFISKSIAREAKLLKTLVRKRQLGRKKKKPITVTELRGINVEKLAPIMCTSVQSASSHISGETLDKRVEDPGLLRNIHLGLATPQAKGETFLVRGNYIYYHYGCDGFQDQGWGCGYRTLQTLCSHIRLAKQHERKSTAKKATAGATVSGEEPKVKREEPRLHEIQKALFDMQDKPGTFVGSKDWIGSVEVSLCLDYFHNVPGKIIHLKSGKDLPATIPELVQHFKTRGTPIMMGGDGDSSSKGVVGVHVATKHSYLLILDPHYPGIPTTKELQQKKWVSWKRADSFMESSFYNLCLPQFTVKKER